MKKVFDAIYAFIVSIATAYLVTSDSNIVFTFLTNLGLTDENFQKTTLVACITLVFIIAKITLEAVYKCITRFVTSLFEKHLKKVEVLLSFQQNNKLLKSMTFTPENNVEYKAQQLTVKIEIKTQGKFTYWLAKNSSAYIEIDFNPCVMDVELYNSWNSDTIFEITEKNTIAVDFFNVIKHGNGNPTLSETILLIPKRIGEASIFTNSEVHTTSSNLIFLKKHLSEAMINCEFKMLEIKCKGVEGIG